VRIQNAFLVEAEYLGDLRMSNIVQNKYVGQRYRFTAPIAAKRSVMKKRLQHRGWISEIILQSASFVLLLAVVVAPAISAHGQTFTVLHTFAGTPDGANPLFGPLLRGKAGNFYGTTAGGGAFGFGTVFEVDTTGNEIVRYSFSGQDGSYPLAGVIPDSQGNVYGTTLSGGDFGAGAVFKLSRKGNYKVLHSFAGSPDGAMPWAALVRDQADNFYGTTSIGGVFNLGTVFKLDPTGAETVLHSFTGVPDGSDPIAALIRDPAGNLYGTTQSGGTYSSGTVFKLDATGKYSVLHSFSGGAGGQGPQTGVRRDAAGNLYGTTCGGVGGGTVFKLDTTGKFDVLYFFAGSPDGECPQGRLIRDTAGNIYGTTGGGGAYGGGTVFKLDAAGNETVLHSFAFADGADPAAGLVIDAAGNLYGSTQSGGDPNCNPPNGCGTVFRIIP
jgi:uncharacterized repeat protein (TIGR03803 family)